MTELSERHGKITRFLSQVTERNATLKALLAIEAVMAPEPTPLQDKCASYETLSGWFARLLVQKAWSIRTKAIEATPYLDPKEVQASAESYEGLVRLDSRYRVIMEQVTTAEKQSEEAEIEGVSIQSEWDELGVCPTCTQPFHAGAHSQQV